VLADARAPALLAPASLPPVLADARAPALLAPASLPPVLADARAPALLALASLPPVLTDPLPRAFLTVVPSVCLPVRAQRTSGPFRRPRARSLTKIREHGVVSPRQRSSGGSRIRRERRFLGSARDDEPSRGEF
jgi:hypothetical protein